MLPNEFWEREKQVLLDLLLPTLERLAIQGAASGAAKLFRSGISFDDRLVHTAAAQWAREKAAQLVRLLSNTSAGLVREAVAEWIETPGATMGQLTEKLKPLVAGNLDRALAIATTETTGAFAQGEALVYAGAGIPRALLLPPAHPRCRCWTTARRLKNGEWVVLWMTNRDEVVCTTPVRAPWGTAAGCRDLHGRVLSDGPYLGRRITEID